MRPLSIHLHNCGSHAETAIDLVSTNALILTGHTGAGKSTLIDGGIGWVLWGVIDGGTDAAVRTGSMDMAVDLVFESRSDKYRVTRTRKLNGRGTSTLDLDIADAAVSSGWRSLAGSNIRDTQARIEAIVGSYDDACSTWYSRQGHSGALCGATPMERRAIVGRLAGLDRFTTYRDVAGKMRLRLDAQATAMEPARAGLEALAGLVSDREAALVSAQDGLATAAGAQAQAEADVKAATERLAALQITHGTIREARARLAAKASEITVAEQRRADRLREAEDAAEQIELLEVTAGTWTTADDAALESARAAEASATQDLDAARARGEAAAETKRAAEKAVEDAERAVKDANAEAALAWERQCGAATMNLKNAETALTVAERAMEAAGRAVDDARARAREEWQARRSDAQQVAAAAERDLTAAQTAVRDAERAITEATRAAADTWRSAVAKADGDVVRAEASEVAAVQALAEARRDASLLDGVPCGGTGEFASCQFLRNAIARRDALQSLGASTAAAQGTLAAAQKARTDLGTIALPPPAEVLAPLQAALATAQDRVDAAGQAQARAAHALAELGTAAPAPADDVLLPLQHQHAEARHAVDAQEAKVAALRHDVAMLGTVPPPPPAEVLAPLQAAVTTARAALADATTARESAATAYRDATARQQTARSTIADLEARRARSEETVRKLADLRGKADAARAEAARADVDVARLRAEHAAMSPQARPDQDLESEVRDVQAAIDGAQANHRRAMQTVADRTSDARDAERLVGEATKAAVDLAATDTEIATIRSQAADLVTLAQAYADIPQLVVETLIPDIEGVANRILARISQTGIAVSLRTQRALKSDKDRVAETLDIIVRDNVGERVYERYSGGERFEIDLALRVALTHVFAARVGLDLRTLVVDEGFGTQDPARIAAIGGVLQTIADMFGLCIVISHVPELAEVFPRRLEVRKGPGGSVATWVE